MKKIFDTGITLVALVVTIVVLLILAGITIVYVFGDNGVFGQASEAKLKTDIANWQERLEMAKSPVFIEGLGTFNPDKYFEYIQQQGIINNKDTDVIDNGDGTYDVTVKPGYVFLVTLIPTPENPTDAEIEYIGQAGKIAPIIKRLDVSATSNSITGKAIVARLGTNGTVKYYYKFTSAADSTYQEITNVTQETGATQSTGITAGEGYTIKVVAKNDVGEVEATAEITATKIMIESLTLDKTKMTIELTKSTTGKITATALPNDATNKNLKWTSSKESVATVDNSGVVTGKASGVTNITAETTDGSNLRKTCEVIVVNKLAESLELNSVRARIATGYTRWLTAVASPTEALQELNWTSSNENVATVDSAGKVTAKAAGTTIITVKTKDGTNLSKTCTVTVATGVDVTTLTSIQSSNKVARDSYGNLITVPRWFQSVN